MAVAERNAPRTTMESAGQLLVADVPIVRPELTMADVRNAMAGRTLGFAGDIAVCEGGRLVGLLALEDALGAGPNALVNEVMNATPPTVTPDVDQEVVASLAVHHGGRSVAVVDDDGSFLGLIPPQHLLKVLLQEHDEDLARLGGFLRGSSTARLASLEPIHRRLWHRVPWLIVGLGGALAAAIIVDGFEDQLRGEVLLAFFIPGVVYLADAVGTQTEAMVIRGLSVGVRIREVLLPEIATGVFAGLMLAAAFFPIGMIIWGDAGVMLSVSLSLLIACSIATVVATTLPWAFSLAGQDPAFGSGPLSTVVQDLLSVTLYLAIASAIV